MKLSTKTYCSKRFWGIVITLVALLPTIGVAQEEEELYDTDVEEVVFKPKIGLGGGMLTFYGDISEGQKANSALVSGLGLDITVTQSINDFVDVSFHLMFGELGANERSLTRNLNFRSNIVLGGINGRYNFNHFLPPSLMVKPYVGLGISSFEFLSKTDLKDANGNTYFYWSDGSIRNIDESSSNASNATVISRDYSFETDIRELNADGFGRYAERSWAMPISAGISFNATREINLELGSALFFTFTDLIDGVTDQSLGTRKGNAAQDKFLYTSFKLSYDLGANDADNAKFAGVDFVALEMGDSDFDGVPDFKDRCSGTPEGVEVDANGCSKDSDKDGIPDHTDEEIESQDSIYVTDQGLFITDEMLEAGLFQPDTNQGYVNTIQRSNIAEDQNYTIQIGSSVENIDNETIDKFLSIPDVETIESNGNTLFLAGHYATLQDAVTRNEELKRLGINTGLILSIKGKNNDVYAPVSQKRVDRLASTTTLPEQETLSETGKVYRVQIGAFKRKLSDDFFRGIDDLITLPASDGITRYYTGAYNSVGEAAQRKVKMIDDGFQGAFIVPFEDGRRISLAQAGGKAVAGKEAEAQQVDFGLQPTGVDKDLIKFTVQVGAYKKRLPTNMLEKLLKLDNLRQIRTVEGLTRYVVGQFDSLEEAKTYQQDVITPKVRSSIVVGEFDGKIITAEEAKDMLNY